MSTRKDALSLFRKLLRSSRKWPGPKEEKDYIREESIRLFRQNKELLDPEVIRAKLFEGQSRHDVAWHYLIPYPRLHHSKQQKYREPPVIDFSWGRQQQHN